MEAAELSSKSEMETMENEIHDGCSAGAFYSNDFAWETLRAEIEDSPRDECEIAQVHSVGICGESPALEFSPNAWEAFHKTHSKALFFKERRYLVKEFPELLSASGLSRILETGCGTGSSVVPILRANKNATVYGCDCSSAALQRATEFVTKQADLDERQIQSFRPFLCDISSDTLPSWLCCSSCRLPVRQDEKQLTELMRSDISPGQACRLPIGERCLGGVDIVTMIFTLSAIAPESMHRVLAEIEAVLQPGGCLLFRDFVTGFPIFDVNRMKALYPWRTSFITTSVSERLYRRKDGTLAYFFSLQVVRDLLTKVGLVEDELYYCCVKLSNRRTGRLMKRVWVHAKFRKLPISAPP